MAAFWLGAAIIVLGTTAPASAEWLARKGPVEVTVDEFKSVLAAMPPKERSSLLMDSQAIQDRLDQILLNKLIVHRAEQQSDLLEQPAVQARLEQARRRVLVKAWLERIAERDGTRGDAEQLAHEYYLANLDRFRQEERVGVRHILISTRKHSDSEAEAIARKVYRELKAGDIGFEQAASEFSEGPSASRGGKLPPFDRNRMVEPFAEAAFALERVGAISEPVKTRHGYHIIKLEERLAPVQSEFEDVKNQLVQQQRKKVREQAKQRYVEQLKTIKPDLNVTSLQRLLDDYNIEEAKQRLRELESENSTVKEAETTTQ